MEICKQRLTELLIVERAGLAGGGGGVVWGVGGLLQI